MGNAKCFRKLLRKLSGATVGSSHLRSQPARPSFLHPFSQWTLPFLFLSHTFLFSSHAFSFCLWNIKCCFCLKSHKVKFLCLFHISQKHCLLCTISKVILRTVSYILSNFLVVWGGKINPFPVFPIWPEAEVYNVSIYINIHLLSLCYFLIKRWSKSPCSKVYNWMTFSIFT